MQTARIVRLGILALLLPCVASGADRKLVNVKIATSPFLSWAPLFVTDAEGLFEKHGIDVEFIRTTGNTDAVPALVARRLDVVPGMLAPGYFNFMARGAEIRFVADKGHVESEGCAYRGFLARKELVEGGKLETLQQLRGLRIAAERTSTSFYDVGCLLKAAGLTDKDVEFVDVPYAAKLAAFETGAIDVATASEPWVTMITDAGHATLWKSDRELIPNHQHSFLLFGPRLLKEDRETGVRFLMAYLEGLRKYHEGKTDRNIDILAQETQLKRDVVARACWVPVRDDASIQLESILEYEKWAVAQGLLDEVVPVEGFWEPSLLEEARKRLLAGD